MGIIRHNTTFYKIINEVNGNSCEIAYADDMAHQHDWKFADEVMSAIDDEWGLEPAYFADFCAMFAEIHEGWMVDANGCHYLVKVTDPNTITITA